jgi:hypothetical protein
MYTKKKNRSIKMYKNLTANGEMEGKSFSRLVPDAVENPLVRHSREACPSESRERESIPPKAGLPPQK